MKPSDEQIKQILALKEKILEKLTEHEEEIEFLTKNLDILDTIRCFFTTLFLAQKQKIELAQIDDDIQITLIDDNKKGEENGQASK